jgi:hypothetical protein
MSQQYDNTDRGVLFKNDRKGHENQPDYKGQINVGGVEFWLSAWIKNGQNGKFMSLSVTAKDDAARQPQPQRQQPNGRQQAGRTYGNKPQDGFEDDLPPF